MNHRGSWEVTPLLAGLVGMLAASPVLGQQSPEGACDIIVSELEAKTYEKNFFMRGRHFPKDIARNSQMMSMQRGQREAATASTKE